METPKKITYGIFAFDALGKVLNANPLPITLNKEFHNLFLHGHTTYQA